MNRLILTVAGLCVGLLAGFLLWGLGSEPAREAARDSPDHQRAPGAGPAAAVATAAAASEIDSLRAKLAAEVARAESLASEVAELHARLSREVVELEDEQREAAASEEPKKPAGATREGGWLDEDILRAAGLHPADIEALVARFEEIELERLFVRDQATREGWVGKPRFRRQMARLGQEYDALREEYGDDDYDWILYASGRPNRVATTLVMQNSPAESAGIEPGDVIVAYDGAKILGLQELQQATTTGDAGDTAAIDVLRDGDELRFYLPVGPLGVQLKAIRSEPPLTR